MIRFFSKLRRVQLQESKVGRYVLYAIGEIFLVVIGILIALQVNNWNEARKTRAYEVVILQEIRENVRLNLERFRMSERRLQTSNAGIHLFLEELAKPVPDRIRLERYFSVMQTGMGFTFTSGAYDSLKAAGLDRVSNRVLRTELITHFDSYLPRISAFLDREYAMVLDDHNNSMNDFLEPVISRDDGGLQQVEMRLPVELNQSNREVLAVLAARTQANQRGAFRLQAVVARTEELQAFLDAEINRAGSVKPKPKTSARKPWPKRAGLIRP